MNESNTSDWVKDRLATLAAAPDWEPNCDRGLEHVQEQQRASRRRRTLRQGMTLAVLIAGAVLMMVPSTRGVAERLLNRFTTRNVEAVRLNLRKADLKGLLPKVEFTTPPKGQRRVASTAEAEQEAGFAPRLPMEFLAKVAAGSIVLGVRGPVVSRMRINAADLRAALRKRGIDNTGVPEAWNGIEITQQVSPSITASFKDGTLMQMRPAVVLAPAGFAIGDFVEIGLLIVGLSAPDAHQLRDKFSESGGMFVLVPSDVRTSFRQVPLAGTHGLLFQNDTDVNERDHRCVFCLGPHELVLTWTTPDRVFQLRTDTLSVDDAVQLANSVPAH